MNRAGPAPHKPDPHSPGSRPRVLVARPIFDEVLEQLSARFELTHNQDDVPWTAEAWRAALAAHEGVLTTPEERISAELLSTAPDLRIVANMAVGYNNLDVAALKARGIVATHTPGVLTETTADMGMALLLAAARRVTEGERFLRSGQWKSWRCDFFVGAEVHGSTLGLLGMGRIGQAIARRAVHGFGMQLIYHNRSRLPQDAEAALNARYVSKAELLRQADHLMLVLPYSAETHHSIGAGELALMKPSATLINIARGGVVDDAALAGALAERRLAAAGLDVFEGEPQVHPGLLSVPNVVLTPHIGSATRPTRLAMAQRAADNLLAYFETGRAVTPI